MTLFTPSLFRQLQRFHIIGGLLALVALLLPGCSAVKLGYNNTPELSYWWLDGYFDFNEPQSLKLRTDLVALQTWHRQNELPAYISTLEKLQRLAPGNLTADQVCRLYTDVKPRLQILVDQIEPTIAALAPTLKTEQIEFLTRKLEKRRTKWRSEWVESSAAERSARGVKQLLDRAELLYGRLEEQQLAVLRASVAASMFDATISARESLRRHQDVVQTLRQLQGDGLSAGRIKTEVHGLMARTMDSPDAAFRTYTEKMTQENCRTFAALHNSTTPAQRLTVVETLKDYALDARALMEVKR